MKTRIIYLLTALALAATAPRAAAQTTTFTYQGRVQDNGTNYTGAGLFQFALITTNATATNSWWSNDGTSGSGSEPANPVPVSVTNGLFTVALGSTSLTAMLALPASVFLQPGLQLKIWFNDGVSGFNAFPLQPLTPAPYATYAATAGSVVNNTGSLTSSNLTLTGSLNLPGITTIDAGGNTLLHADGNFNFFAGQNAGNLANNSTYNVGIGQNALSSIANGGLNTAVGVDALGLNTSGFYNTAIGFSALGANKTAYNNTAIGSVALQNSTTGSNNVAIGYAALANSVIDNGVVAIGFGALQSSAGTGGLATIGSGNEAVGYLALQANTSGVDNTAIGYQSLYQNVGGYNNTAVGLWSLLHNNSGYNNTVNGAYALEANTSGYQNTASGTSALGANTTGYANTAMGNGALEFNTGNLNTANGAGALAGATGSGGGGNTASGANALFSLTTGYNNVAAGLQALFTNTIGYDNVAVGVSTLYNSQSGGQNTVVGTYGFQNMTAGSGNVALGYSAGAGLVSGSNNIYIGNPGASADNNVIRIGNGQTTTYIAGSTVGINMSNPSAALDVNGPSLVVEGSSGGGAVRAYIGDNGTSTPIVQIGSMVSGVTEVDLLNLATLAPMAIHVSSITIEGGADLAEPFAITQAQEPVSEGEVVVIDAAHPGQLKLTDQPYDTRVAGVVSGANGIHPGIQMHQQGLLEGGRNVALTGRVYVQADTSNGAIEPGDLLTTSGIPGRAMRVSDHARAEGAILGKAMTALEAGHGMVLVLVTLQ